MKICLFIICLNYIDVHSRNYVIRYWNSRIPKNAVVYKLVRHSQNSRKSNHDNLALHLINEKSTQISTVPHIETTTLAATVPTMKPFNPEPMFSFNNFLKSGPNLLADSQITTSATFLPSQPTNFNFYGFNPFFKPGPIPRRNIESNKRIAFKEDLDKLLQEIAEKQRNAGNPNSKAKDPTGVFTFPVSIPREYSGKPIVLENIGQILGLLQGGTKFDQYAPAQQNDLEWLKIKIPKT